GVRNNLSDPPSYSGNVEIELHGSSTLWLPKKSYGIQTLDALGQKVNVPLFGLPEEHDWIFKAQYQDKSLVRDELTFNISQQMGNYSSRTKFFEMVVDGDYRGVYHLEEKIKRDVNRVDISKLKAEEIVGDDVTGGYIIRLDKKEWDDEGWYSNFNSNITNDSANFFLYTYPKPDSMPFEQKEYIKNYMHSFEAALTSPTFADPVNGYSKYINVPSFVDFFLMNEMSRNVDGYRASTYMFKDKDSNGDGKLHMGPIWDFNLAWKNASYNGGSSSTGWQYQTFATEYYVPFWWWQLMSDPNFANQLKCRYQSLRTNVLSIPRINQLLDSMAIYLDESQIRNFNRWPIMGSAIYPNPIPVPANYAGEIQQIKTYVLDRLSWLDANMPGTCTVGIEEEQEEKSLIRSYPNPFNNSFTILYNIPVAGTIRIELMNMLGERAMMVTEGTKAAGNYEETIVPVDVSAGMYVIKMTVNGSVYYKKIIKNGD
ncbi:MAG: CotH kinase family protein, partial [Bacteroidota bacterium]|nr:CotH kinase family protein [Bacteroidota bacterium]